jgi:hypothetical protein
MPPPAHRSDERPPTGWTAGVLFDELMPTIIGIVILLFVAAVFIASSGNYPGL